MYLITERNEFCQFIICFIHLHTNCIDVTYQNLSLQILIRSEYRSLITPRDNTTCSIPSIYHTEGLTILDFIEIYPQAKVSLIKYSIECEVVYFFVTKYIIFLTSIEVASYWPNVSILYVITCCWLPGYHGRLDVCLHHWSPRIHELSQPIWPTEDPHGKRIEKLISRT